MLLSIIVPMYKVEDFIQECLESILNQSFDKERVEVIAINDGSPDKSIEIAKRIAETDDRLTVVSQENQGLSGARNKGLSMASGEYVWFIDSDDWISENSIASICDAINIYHPDAIHICGADVIDNTPIKLFSLKKCESDLLNGVQMIRNRHFHGVVQYTVYKKSVLTKNKLSFYEGIYHEDTEFSPRAYYYLKTIKCIDQVLYLKRVNDDSITRKVNPKKNYDLINVSQSLRKFANSISNEDDKKLYMRLSANALKGAMTNEYDYMSPKIKRELNAVLRSNVDLLNSFNESDRGFLRFQALLLRLFSSHMLQINNLICNNSITRKRTTK